MRRKILTLGILRILSFPFARGLAIVFEKVLGLLLLLVSGAGNQFGRSFDAPAALRGLVSINIFRFVFPR